MGGDATGRQAAAALGATRVKINVLEDATMVARALGLDVELPDVGSRDPAYWEALRRDGWKRKLRGRVLDTEEDGDPDWCTLLAFPFCAVRFDLEEGVVVLTTVADLVPALDLVQGLAGRGGVALRGAGGEARVKAMPCSFRRDVSAAFAAAGLVPEEGGGRRRLPPVLWEPDPARWPGA